MADTPESTDEFAPEAEGGEVAPPVLVNAQYIKDLSFEAPTAPGVFQLMQQQQPEINVNINVDTNKFDENVFEVILSMAANATIGEETAFILELEYAGVFTLNCPPEHLQPLVFIECPRLLFPFARAILAQITRDGGFPPLMVGSVDFVAMFQRELESQGEQQAQAEGNTTESDVAEGEGE
jgi:preprotein translocase subunit SecB